MPISLRDAVDFAPMARAQWPRSFHGAGGASPWRVTTSGTPAGWNPPTRLGATMPKHRHPQDSVSNDVHVDNFDPAEALERLHRQTVQLEAIANAANEATTQLPFPSDRDERRVFDRVYALIAQVADLAAALVSEGDKAIAALAAYRAQRGEDVHEISPHWPCAPIDGDREERRVASGACMEHAR